LPFIFLQYWRVLCKVSGNLSERVFLLELDFAMTNILNCNQVIVQDNQTINQDLVVVKVVVRKSLANFIMPYVLY